MLISAIATRDYPVIQAGIVVFALFVVLVNLAMDLALHRGRSPDRVQMTDIAADAAETLAPAPGRFDAFTGVIFGRPAHHRSPLIVILALRAGGGVRSVGSRPTTRSRRASQRSTSRLAAHWLGTDQFGRDVLSRMIYGSRNSLILGLLSPAIAGDRRHDAGRDRRLFRRHHRPGDFGRLVDLLLAFPELLLGIIIAAALGGGFWNIVVVITVAFVPGFARVARASTLAVRQEPYVEAAVAVRRQHAGDHLPPHPSQHRRAHRGAD